MNGIETLRFVLGALMSLMMVFLLVGLLPSVRRRQQALERRLKAGGPVIVPISPLRRLLAALLCAMLAAQLFYPAFYSSLVTLTGFSPSVLFAFTFLLLPFLVLVLTVRDAKRFKRTRNA